MPQKVVPKWCKNDAQMVQNKGKINHKLYSKSSRKRSRKIDAKSDAEWTRQSLGTPPSPPGGDLGLNPSSGEPREGVPDTLSQPVDPKGVGGESI